MFSSLIFTLIFFVSFIAAEDYVVCIPPSFCIASVQPIRAKIGATVSPHGVILLFPGVYPQAAVSNNYFNVRVSNYPLVGLPGFTNHSSIQYPLNITLEPGVLIYSGVNYTGQSTLYNIPSGINNSIINSTATSVALGTGTFAYVTTGHSGTPFVIWTSVPDVTQFPSSVASTTLNVIQIQSSTCSTPCSSAGVCTTQNVCACASGFNGTACEVCQSGFYGPNCQPCPTGCTQCSDGLTGTGRCLSTGTGNSTGTSSPSNPSGTLVPNANITSCNCINGVCQSNGQCTCNAGWTTAPNGTACAQCQSGYYLTTSGNCNICAIGCTKCEDGTGICDVCQSGFTQDPNDKTACNQLPTNSTTGLCPTGAYSNGASCSLCDQSCHTCTGPSSNNCVICGTGTYTLNGTCVSASSTGICSGSRMIADNVKKECDSCPAKCTDCNIPGFTASSTVDKLQCTACLPGYTVSSGKCVGCPVGSFLDPNNACIACDSSCLTCAGSPTNCLTCPSNNFILNGTCVSSCPSKFFTSGNACLSCHPDCATCSGGNYDQCLTCPSTRPVKSNGRCLLSCGLSQYYDTTSNSCASCDSTCSSCIGAGSSNCLACSDSGNVLRGGTCVKPTCRVPIVAPGTGLCLTDIID